MLGRWQGCHHFHMCSHHLSFLTCLAFLLLMRSRIRQMSAMMSSQKISSMGTHMSHSVSTMGTHRGSILRSPQGRRTLVQRFTLQRPIHRFRQLCFALIPGDCVLRQISQGLLHQLGQHLCDVQHASLLTPTLPDVPASTPTVMSDFSFFLLFLVFDAKEGENQRGKWIFDTLLLCFLFRSDESSCQVVSLRVAQNSIL